MRPVGTVSRLLSIPRRPAFSRSIGIVAGSTRVAPSFPSTFARNTICPPLSSRRCFNSTACVLADIGNAGSKKQVHMEDFPPERIRNLSIIAHIDHGKSTLADRLLQMTNTLPPESSPQFLDKLKVERERGITVKAQTVSIIHPHTDGKRYLINLIDTPGHVDFSYEVSRSLGACEGGLLLVDCTQGIQAQTLSVFHHALDAELKLLAVINKVDLPHASPEETSDQIASSLGLPTETHMFISAKSGIGVDEVLRQIVEGLPSPHWEGDQKLRALVFDTFYDRFRGVVSLVRIVSGSIKKGDKIRFLQAGKKFDVLDVGINNPDEVPVDRLYEGQVGYIVCNMKNSEDAHIGDTVCWADKPVDPLPGFKPMKAMVYAGVFPTDSGEFPLLEESINRLTLNDRSVSVERESSAALGQGYRLGFLGTLHMDVFRQRLEDEYSSNVIVTAPTVPYKVVYNNGKEVFISNPAEFPDVTDTKTKVHHVEEPMVNATIFVPTEYLGDMMELCSRYRGVQQEYKYLDGTDRAILRYSLPLSEIVTDFFSELKSASSGFASFDYEEAGYERSDLVKLNMLLNSKPVDALAMIVHKDAAQQIGRGWTKKLKEVLPRQLFELAIQAAVGQRVVARETLSAVRKDVTAGLYGGHYERKMKHLNKQKEGKKRLKRLAGNIDIPQSAFFDVLSTRPRSYSTCARAQQADGAGQDWLAAHLPYPPAANTETTTAVELETPSPLSPHHVSPQQRSRILSDIHRRTTTRTDETSEELFNDFMRLYISCPTHLLTVPELQSIARATYALDRTGSVGVRQSHERFETVVNALRDVVGDNSKATRGLEVAMILSTRDRRHVEMRDLHNAENEFTSLFPTVPTSSEQLANYQKSLNQILYLSALAGSTSRLNMWWQQLLVAGLEPDSWSYLARIVLYGQMRRVDTLLEELSIALQKVTQPDSAIVLVNCAMWMSARAGEWSVVSQMYDALQTTSQTRLGEALGVTQSTADLQIPDVSHLRPSRNTYSMLVAALAHRGDLVAALTILRQMFDEHHVPSVDEYASIFRGFARHGVIRDGPAGDATAAFPMWRDFSVQHTQGLSDPWGDRQASASSPGVFTSNYDTRTTASSMWTHSALDDLFTSFLALTPTKSTAKPLAPSRTATYHILLAFARVTNADAVAVREALDALTLKFGPGNEEGWIGWHMDKRLRRVRDIVGAGLEEEDGQLEDNIDTHL